MEPNSSSNAQESIEIVDKVLPEAVDRRQFIVGSVGAAMAGLAGCLGGDDDTGAADLSEDGIVRDAVWRCDWTIGANNMVTVLADHEGYLEEFDVSLLSGVDRGFGSGDTARRVGSLDDNDRLGKANFIPVVQAIDAGYDDIQIFASDRPRSAVGLIYRPEAFDDPTSYSDKTIRATESLEDTYPFFELNHGMADSADELNNDYGSLDESVMPSSLQSGDVDAVWNTTNTFADIRGQVDIDLGFEPLYGAFPVVEDVLFTNREWLEEEDNEEFVARCLSAHSHAAKWVLLNPEEAAEILRSEVSPNLQALELETVVESVRTGVIALALTDDVREQGYNYLDTDDLESTMAEIGDVFDLDLPDTDDITAPEIQEEAELATYDDDEWDQIIENAGEWSDLIS